MTELRHCSLLSRTAYRNAVPLVIDVAACGVPPDHGLLNP
jgi:hypothetical protein